MKSIKNSIKNLERLNTFLTYHIDRFLDWRKQHISDRKFILLASALVGVTAGLAAALLKGFVGTIENFLNHGFQWEYKDYLFFLYPLIGILLTVFYVKRYRKDKLGRGVGNIIDIISRKDSNVEKDKMYSHIITGGLTIGFGGSMGLESPIVVTGSAIGSNIARKLKFDYADKTFLLAAGAAAGISAIFNSPIAGVLFAIEVLLYKFTIAAFIPLLIASASAAVISRMLYSQQLFYLITDDWKISAIPFYILLGVLGGLISVYVIRVSLYVEKKFQYRKKSYQKAILGGLVLGILIFFLPSLYGEGYSTVSSLLNQHYKELTDRSLYSGFRNSVWFNLLFASSIIFVKPFASSITLSSGGNGGIFAPSLFIGALIGYVFSHTLNVLGIADLNEANFIVVGMVGAMSGIMHAPLTAIFLIAEITGGYALFVPLMITAAIAYSISKYFEPSSIFTKRSELAQR